MPSSTSLSAGTFVMQRIRVAALMAMSAVFSTFAGRNHTSSSCRFEAALAQRLHASGSPLPSAALRRPHFTARAYASFTISLKLTLFFSASVRAARVGHLEIRSPVFNVAVVR